MLCDFNTKLRLIPQARGKRRYRFALHVKKNLKKGSGNIITDPTVIKSSLICSGGQRSGAKRRRLDRGGPPALPVRRSGGRRQRPEEQPTQPPGGRPAVRRPTPDPGGVPEAGPTAPALAGGRRGVRHGE
jgi:hypothetical protein